MFFKNSIVVLVLAALVIELVCGNEESKHKYDRPDNKNNGHNLILGKREITDKLVKHEKVTLGHRWFWYVNYDVKAVLPANPPSSSKITYIEVKDLVPHGLGGFPSVAEGGIGSDNVTIHLHSRWFLGINFDINIYGIV